MIAFATPCFPVHARGRCAAKQASFRHIYGVCTKMGAEIPEAPKRFADKATNVEKAPFDFAEQYYPICVEEDVAESEAYAFLLFDSIYMLRHDADGNWTASDGEGERRYATQVHCGVVFMYLGDESQGEAVPIGVLSDTWDAAPSVYMRQLSCGFEAALEKVAGEPYRFVPRDMRPDFVRAFGEGATCSVARNDSSIVADVRSGDNSIRSAYHPLVVDSSIQLSADSVRYAIFASPLSRSSTRLFLLSATSRKAIWQPRWVANLNKHHLFEDTETDVGEVTLPKAEDVLASYRELLKRSGSSAPWSSDAQVAAGDKLDRFHSHTKHSVASMGAVKGFERASEFFGEAAKYGTIAALCLVASLFTASDLKAQLSVVELPGDAMSAIVLVSLLLRRLSKKMVEQLVGDDEAKV